MNMEKTGGFIAALRKEKGWTQAQLAEQILVSDKAVSRWETGRGFPDIGNMEALAACLDVTEALRRRLSDGKVTFLLVREAREYGDDRDNYKKVAVAPSNAELTIW